MGADADNVLFALSNSLLHRLAGGNIKKEDIDSFVDNFAANSMQEYAVELTNSQIQIAKNIVNKLYDRFAASDAVQDSMSLYDLSEAIVSLRIFKYFRQGAVYLYLLP